MNIQDILSHVDHTLLRPQASWEEIRQLIDEAIDFHTASVCIPPSYVRQAAEYAQKRIPICTVIGFPNGYSTTAAKCFETADAVKNGADEIDMVINLGWVKDGKFDFISEEIQMVKTSCGGKILKVIIETCLLTQEEKLRLCQTVSASGADFIKTSTGFGGGGATPEDISLLRRHCPGSVKVKAAGGIASLEDAERFLQLGADRLGTSRLVALAKKA